MFAGDALPGIRVDIVPAPLAETLPRMDVAVFAGFAERGPCHVAISVSSVAAYEAVFGGDCPLAWDASRGRGLAGMLAASVRAFFSNGGRLCWAIRLAETDALAAARAAELGAADPGSRPARAGRFALSGLLRRLPTALGDATEVSPALLDAASLGSWSDAMRLAARVSRQAVTVADAIQLPHGLSFPDPGMLAPGDLIELTGGEGRIVRYAKALRIAGGTAYALWVGSFARIAEATPTRTGSAEVAGVEGSFAAELDEGQASRLRMLDSAGAKALVPGRWVRFRQAGKAWWLRADAIDGDRAVGRAWLEVPSRLPKAPFTASKVTLDLAEHRPGADRVQAGLAPAPEAANAVHALVDADLFHADPANRTAAIRPGFAIPRDEAARIAKARGQESFAAVAARFGTAAFSLADRIALRSAWLPLGLEASFAEGAGPLPSNDDPLVRDGLSRFDARLFLDPRLAPLRGPALVERAQAVKDLGEQPLFGLHAAFDIAGDLFPEPSLIALPDAAQPGWALAAPPETPPQPKPGAPERADWRTHKGGCPPAKTPPLEAPDRGAFLDLGTVELAAPTLTAPTTPVAGDAFELSWGAQPNGAIVVLEEASQPDFSDAAEILREKNVTHLAVTGRAEGIYYYRLHIELGDNVSAYASAVVVLRKARYAATEADPGLLATLHAALLRLAGANGDFFALLSLPVAFRTAEAAAYARALATLAPGAGSDAQLGADEARLLSYGALYHPWLVARAGGGLLSAPPDGAVAGLMAARARDRGAWIAPANEPLRDIIGLDPALPQSELLALDRARVNMVRRPPIGFALHDADTLSGERDWRPLNVRRLMMLLRRFLLRRGMTYVFEPNGPVLRRAIERSLISTLDELQLRGAFAGASSAQSYRFAVQQEDGNEEAGRLVVEIAVAPSQPVRFLTIRLVQQGARLTIMEAAA
jgi:hypothetical protein